MDPVDTQTTTTAVDHLQQLKSKQLTAEYTGQVKFEIYISVLTLDSLSASSTGCGPGGKWW